MSNLQLNPQGFNLNAFNVQPAQSLCATLAPTPPAISAIANNGRHLSASRLNTPSGSCGSMVASCPELSAQKRAIFRHSSFSLSVRRESKRAESSPGLARSSRITIDRSWMSAEVKKEIQLEIAHVLFIDIVGYSKLSINEQRAVVDTLNQIVRGTEEFRSAEAAGRSIINPTSYEMAVVYYTSPEAPPHCAVAICGALKE